VNNVAQKLILFLFLVLIVVLAGCGGHTSRVIDTPETRQLKGWQKPYEVDGKRYHPLRDHYGFQQRGIASWYGRKFHGRKTSNGEVYDMYGKSAAHKTLPMGVYVRVTNLVNKHQIVVRINDRGPFVAGRIIDLSYGAAKELGIVTSGTAKVHLQALGYHQAGEDGSYGSSRDNYDSGSFAVQIGAFTVASNAQKLASEMLISYGKAEVSAIDRDGKRIYRVWVGEYKSLELAEQATSTFITAGYAGSYVVAFD